MGCDIHLQVERRIGAGWHRVPHPTRPCDDAYCTDGLYNDQVPNEKMRGEPHYLCGGTGLYTHEFYADRNYDVFAMLADVRNGSGFAGVDTGDGFVPLSPPRGLPLDVGEEIAANLKRAGYTLERDGDALRPNYVGRDWGEGEGEGDWCDPQYFWLGDHSWTHMTVAELLAYDWDRATLKRGWVDPWNCVVWKKEGKPGAWSGGVSGLRIEHITWQEMLRRIEEGDIAFEGDEPHPGSWEERRYTTHLGRTLARESARYVCLVEWLVTYAERAKHFLEILHRDIVPLGEPEDVRLVMGFDS